MEQLEGLLQSSAVVVGLRYQGLTVKQLQEFRRSLPQESKMLVCKVRRAGGLRQGQQWQQPCMQAAACRQKLAGAAAAAAAWACGTACSAAAGRCAAASAAACQPASQPCMPPHRAALCCAVARRTR